MLPDFKPVNNLSFTSIFSFFPHFLSTYTFFPPWNSGVYDLLKWLISELTHWVTENAFVGGSGEPESSSLTTSLVVTEREFDSQMLLKGQKLKFLRLNGEHLVKGSLEVSQYSSSTISWWYQTGNWDPQLWSHLREHRNPHYCGI